METPLPKSRMCFKGFCGKRELVVAKQVKPGGSDSKESSCNEGDQGSIPGSVKKHHCKIWSMGTKKFSYKFPEGELEKIWIQNVIGLLNSNIGS